MERIDMEVDDFINYCDYKGLSKKTYGSYEQSFFRTFKRTSNRAMLFRFEDRRLKKELSKIFSIDELKNEKIKK